MLLLITGRVHGVAYRISAKRIADKLNISGWIKNNQNGTVSIMAEGGYDSLVEFKKWCKQGPKSAEVEAVDSIWEKYIGDLEGFVILY